MLQTQSRKSRTPYHGWSIAVVRQGSELDLEFYFECYAPTLPDFCNDGEGYADENTAFAAACEFIDREIAIQALLEVASEWFYTGQICEAEYWNLTNFA